MSRHKVRKGKTQFRLWFFVDPSNEPMLVLGYSRPLNLIQRIMGAETFDRSNNEYEFHVIQRSGQPIWGHFNSVLVR